MTAGPHIPVAWRRVVRVSLPCWRGGGLGLCFQDPAPQRPRDRHREQRTTATILTEQLTKNYGQNRGIVSLDLEVKPGEVFGFLGPNGAGKTTTIRLLLDLIRPTSGRALVLGCDSHHDTLAIQARVGYLPGELGLYPQLSGQQTLRYIANLRGGIDWNDVRRLSERLDCDLERKVSELSTGNKRKLGLIQAFMHRPELLILDEPTVGLDPLVQHEFYGLIDEARAAGQTVFLSSHVLPEVQRVCDRVAFIREGKLVAVEDVGALTGKAVREIEIVFAEPVPASAFAGVAGVSAVAANGKGGTSLRLTVSGSLEDLFAEAGILPRARLHKPPARPRRCLHDLLLRGGRRCCVTPSTRVCATSCDRCLCG